MRPQSVFGRPATLEIGRKGAIKNKKRQAQYLIMYVYLQNCFVTIMLKQFINYYC